MRGDKRDRERRGMKGNEEVGEKGEGRERGNGKGGRMEKAE